MNMSHVENVQSKRYDDTAVHFPEVKIKGRIWILSSPKDRLSTVLFYFPSSAFFTKEHGGKTIKIIDMPIYFSLVMR